MTDLIMIEVYIVHYGYMDQGEDVFDSVWEKFDDAKAYMEQCAQEAFDDDPSMTDEGLSYNVHDTKVVIVNSAGEELEWWRCTASPLR